MSLFSALNHPNFRYKLISFGVSAGIFLVLWSGSTPETSRGLLGFAMLSTALTGGVMIWYTILVGAEKLVAAYFAGRDSSIGLMDKWVTVWLTTGAVSAPCAFIAHDQWSPGSGQTILLVVTLMVVVSVSVMRTMDLRDDNSTTISVGGRVSSASYESHPWDRHVGHPSFGLGNELVDGDSVTIEDVPTKTI